MLNSIVFLAMLSLVALMLALVWYDATANLILMRSIGAVLAISFSLAFLSYFIADVEGRLQTRKGNWVSSSAMAVMFLMITTGLILHNSWAVLQGLFGRVTPFVRTPKLNSAGIAAKRRNHYLTPTKILPILLELAFGFLLTASGWRVLHGPMAFVAVTFGFFAIGFFMIVFFSVSEMLGGESVEPVAAVLL